jgi:hypothetical protein
MGDVPEWVRHRLPGTFDRRVLDQDRVWVTVAAEVLWVERMSTEHLRAVLAWLERRAAWLHFEAMVDATMLVLAREPDEPPTAEQVAHHLGGATVADLRAQDWVRTTALWRGINRELRRRREN